MPTADITTNRRDGVSVASVRGDIDLVNHEAVSQDLLTTALSSGPRLVIDLCNVRYVDSNGVRMLYELASELNHSRIEWIIALGEGSPLSRLFKVTAFDEVACIVATVDDAVATLTITEGS